MSAVTTWTWTLLAAGVLVYTAGLAGITWLFATCTSRARLRRALRRRREAEQARAAAEQTATKLRRLMHARRRRDTERANQNTEILPGLFDTAGRARPARRSTR